MIPWQDFQPQQSCWSLGLPVEPHEEYLHFLQDGPSMAECVFESPMMELAHERQFVISQQGGDSAGFQGEHTQRIGTCLKMLDHHFQQCAGSAMLGSVPTPPPVDETGLWLPTTSLETSNTLELDLTNPSAQTSQSPMQDPAPYPPLASSPSLPSSNSGWSAAMPPRILEDVEFSDDQDDSMVRSFLANECHRSGRFRYQGSFRAQKSIRQRRRSPIKPGTLTNNGAVEYKAAHAWHTEPTRSSNHRNPDLENRASFLLRRATTDRIRCTSAALEEPSRQDFCSSNQFLVDQT